MSSLRPLSLGEIIDSATSVWRSNFKTLVLLFLPYQLFEFATVKVGTAVGRVLFPGAGGVQALELMKRDPTAGLGQLAGFVGILGVAMALTLIAGQLASVTASRLLYPWLTGAPAGGLGPALRFAWENLGPALGSLGLSLGWTVVVGLGALVPGAALMAGGALVDRGAAAAVLMIVGFGVVLFGLVVLLLWAVIRFLVLPQVLAVEQRGAWHAFRRAGELSSGSVGPGLLGWVKARLTVLLTVVYGVLLIVSLVSSLPTLILGVVYGAGFAPGHTVDDVVPQIFLVPSQVLQAALSALVMPLIEAFKVTFYVDMRVRREGLDLSLSLARPT